MTSDPIILMSSNTIAEAVETFATKKVSSIPVQNTMGEIMGQLTDAGILRALVMHQLVPADYKVLNDCAELMEKVVFVKTTDSLTQVIQAVFKSPNRRVLVKDEGRKIYGIISPKDLVRFLRTASAEADSIRAEIKKFSSNS